MGLAENVYKGSPVKLTVIEQTRHRERKLSGFYSDFSLPPITEKRTIKYQSGKNGWVKTGPWRVV
jgi:hypothetical protein